MPQPTVRTEFEFELPVGYVDQDGKYHRKGVMRLAKAADELYSPENNPGESNPAYWTIIILSRVVVKLGSLDMINTQVIENLFSEDFAYLQDFYNRINKKRAADEGEGSD